jgi:hypothetical protein
MASWDERGPELCLAPRQMGGSRFARSGVGFYRSPTPFREAGHGLVKLESDVRGYATRDHHSREPVTRRTGQARNGPLC